MKFQNKATLKNPAVDGMREISQRRAATIANMIDEAKKRGLDDSFAYDGIAKYGVDNAKDMKSDMKDPEDFSEFAELFGTDHNKDIYEMEKVETTENTMVIDFHYCPYVEEWMKQGRTPEEISRLCVVTMAGDHAFAKEFSCMDFELESTIADGASACRLRFSRKK